MLDSFARDINRLLSPLASSNSEAASAVQQILSSATSQGNALKQDVQRGVKSAADAAGELYGIVKAAFGELRGLLVDSGAAEASASAAAGVAADAAAAISDVLARDRPVAALLQLGQVQVRDLGWWL